jgi:hypothetical protein
MSTLVDSGAVALEAIIVASIVVPAVILVGVCWIFYRAKKREDEAARPGRQSLDRQPRYARGRHLGIGRITAPHHGRDRLSRVDVVFEVASEQYPLDERAATRMAENLRVKAAHEPGAEGATGARAVADAIELRLIEDTADPITLGGDEAEAVFYAPEAPTGESDRLSALRHAVKRLHDEWIR